MAPMTQSRAFDNISHPFVLTYYKQRCGVNRYMQIKVRTIKTNEETNT
jgi:hypothetical protein